ncbi:Oidioi.mRNA.OKI2018_I69.chr1.g29.t1.cds [Oikopleura dioica]|uniref:Phospholipid scramblase n=1 Tax=Oikopleura dioica TaxID=34765 RepID=A0ABN7SIK0_OIKDI|nr:Oidioi.mRNA.OKI2018_I69.chr1.g29.t1.cds [Oikopleura dioica]
MHQNLFLKGILKLNILTNGNIVGKIRQVADLSKPIFSIQTADDQEVLRLTGPALSFACCGDLEFEVSTADGVVVGKVSKKWEDTGGEFLKEIYTDADKFGVTFPVDLDVNVKLSLLGCVFLLDFMFFEDSCKWTSHAKDEEEGSGSSKLDFLMCICDFMCSDD